MTSYADGLRRVGAEFRGRREIWPLLTKRAARLAELNAAADAPLSLVGLVDKYANGTNVFARTWRLCDSWNDAFVPWSDSDAEKWGRTMNLMRSAASKQPAPVLRDLVYRAYVMGGVLAARAPNYQPRDAKDSADARVGVAGDMPALFPTLFCVALYACVFHPRDEKGLFENFMVALAGRRHGFREVERELVKPPVAVGQPQLSHFEGPLKERRGTDDWVSCYMNLPPTADGKIHPFAISSALQLEMGLMHMPFALRAWQATPAGSQLLVGKYGAAEPYVGEVLYSQPGFLLLKLRQRGSAADELAHFVLSYSTLSGEPTFVLREWTGKNFANARGFNLHLEQTSSNYVPLRRAYRTGEPVVLRGG